MHCFPTARDIETIDSTVYSNTSIISDEARYLGEILDLVPMAKITWGGIYVCIEDVHARTNPMWEHLVSGVSEKYERYHYDLHLCKKIARHISANRRRG